MRTAVWGLLAVGMAVAVTDTIYAQSESGRKILIEEFTGAWCGACPNGGLALNDIALQNEDVVIVSVHTNDAMEVPEALRVVNAYIQGFPSAMIDRYLFPDRTNLELYVQEWQERINTRRMSEQAVPSLRLEDVAYDRESREVSATVRATFHDDYDENLRLNLLVVEDSVSGVGEGYDQTNYFNEDAGHPYFGKGEKIKGYIHRHVLREMLGGAWGTESVIPKQTTAGESYTFTYSTTLHGDWKPEHIKLVGLVQRYSGDVRLREVLNAVEVELPFDETHSGVVSGLATAGVMFQVKPSIVTDNVVFEIGPLKDRSATLTILDLMGQSVRAVPLSDGIEYGGAVEWDGRNESGERLSSGVYFARLITANQVIVQKLIIRR